MIKVNSEAIKARGAQREFDHPEKVNPVHKAIIEEAGACYEPGMMGDLVLFTSFQTGSTLAIKESDLTVDAVRDHLALSNLKFQGA